MIFSRDHIRRADVEYQKGNLRRAAELYLKAKRFQQAAEVYVELGEIDKAVAVYVDAGRPSLGAELLAAQGRTKEAIALYEEAGAYAQAAEACMKVQQLVRAGRLFAQAKRYRRSAEVFIQAGEMERALRAWETAGEVLRGQRKEKSDPALEKKIRELDGHRAEILATIGRPLEAAELMAEHGQMARAAALYRRAGRFSQAARSYLDAGRVTEALSAIAKAPDAEDGLKAEIYLECAQHEKAAEIFERIGRFDAAASAWEGAEEWERAARLWERAESYGRAAEFFLRRDLYLDAGRCFAMADQHEKAAAAFASGGDEQSAGDAYVAAEDPLAAGRQYLKAGQATAARDTFQAVSPQHADYAAASLQLLPLLIDEGLLDAAQQRLEALRDSGAEIEGPELEEWEKRLRQARRDTSPVDLPPPETRTRAAERLEKTAPMPGAASGARALDPTALPFDLGERIDPWWSGADFFRAEDRRSGQPILLVSFPLAEVASRVEGFRQAMRQIAALDHPTILKLDETILVSDKVLLLYEPFHGETLGSLLAVRRLPALTSLSYVMQLAAALSTAHKLGVTHQWVSPRTVLVDGDGRIKLVGIGLRDVLADRDATSRAYFSPEVREGGVVGPASDVYSLGLLGIELLQAQMPAGWDARPAVDPEAVGWRGEVEQAVPRSARDALVRALARDPLARPSTSELAAALSSLGLVPGQILADRYEIRGELGRGGMSRVYRALDRHLGDEEVAIKTVLTPALGQSEDERRLLSEVRICRRISHPNVVRVHDVGRFAGGIFVTMELLDGPGLDAVIKEETPLSTARVRKILRGIAGALSEAHRLAIIHRDLKPSNVILVGDRVKVLDFGIARMGDSSMTANLTRTGQVVGSPMFMAPEQIQGQPLAGTCDLYALGVIAYTLLTGREPFLADTTTAIVMKHLHEPPPDVRKLRPELPDGWVEMLRKLLAKKPEDRYQSARELLEVLERLPV